MRHLQSCYKWRPGKIAEVVALDNVHSSGCCCADAGIADEIFALPGTEGSSGYHQIVQMAFLNQHLNSRQPHERFIVVNQLGKRRRRRTDGTKPCKRVDQKLKFVRASVRLVPVGETDQASKPAKCFFSAHLGESLVTSSIQGQSERSKPYDVYLVSGGHSFSHNSIICSQSQR